MSIDSSDLVESALSEQARRNAAFIDHPDTNTLITDFAPVYPVETIGFQAEVTATTAFGTVHKWGDPPTQTQWGFFKWGPGRAPNTFQFNAFEDDAFQVDVN